MEAKELMIGDWVYSAYSAPEKWQPRQWNITYCEGNFIGLANPGTSCKPIPLTKEILKANGAYDADDGCSVAIDCYFNVLKDVVLLAEYKGSFELSVLTCVDATGEANEVYDLPQVKYVHQLQHALRLCGLQDLADNFKI